MADKVTDAEDLASMNVNRYRARARETTNDPRPWVQLKNELARQIELGILEPGDEVAVTLEAQDFGITRPIARKAFRALVEEGKLISPQSRGRPYRVAMSVFPGAGGSGEAMPGQGRAEIE
jgi:hypothetical protein